MRIDHIEMQAMTLSRPGPEQIIHDAAGHVFQLQVEGVDALLEYRRDDGLMTITHTRVPGPIGGRGVAALLTTAALEFARANGLKVAPACSYAAAFMQRHGEYADLLE